MPLPSIKRVLQQWIYPVGSIATIRRGPLKGCRYAVTERSGWAPILGRCEPEAQALYCRLVAPGETVWDLGAHTGIHSLLFSRLAGAAGHVVAFEPLGPNADEIARTCSLNGARNVAIARLAISDARGRATFFAGRHSKQGSLVDTGSQAPDTVEVDCTTLDNELQAHPQPDFIKIDIEGAESRALRGFTLASRFHPTFAIDLHTPDEDVAVGRWLSGYGYKAYRLLDRGSGKRDGAHGGLVSPILRLDQGWPSAGGIWGTVVAVHPARMDKVRIVESLCAARS